MSLRVDACYHDPGLIFSLGRWQDAGIEGLDAAAAVTAVFEVLAEFLSPLSVDLYLMAETREEQNQIEVRHPFWCATDARAEETLSLYSMAEDPVRRRLDRLTPAAIGAFIAEAIEAEGAAAGAGADVVLTWRELYFWANEVRLPASYDGGDVFMLYERGEIRGMPVLRRGEEAWVQGQQHFGLFEPIVISLRNWESLDLEFTINWSLWYPEEGGRRDLERVCDALVARGWKHRTRLGSTT